MFLFNKQRNTDMVTFTAAAIFSFQPFLTHYHSPDLVSLPFPVIETARIKPNGPKTREGELEK